MPWLGFEFEFPAALPVGMGSESRAGVRLGFELPCPTVDLLSLVAALADWDADEATEALWSVLRDNPTLMLLALSTHHRHRGFAATTPAELLGWCSSGLLAILDQRLLAAVDRPFIQPTGKTWRRYLQVQPDLLRSGMRRWLKQATSLDLQSRHAMVDAWLSESFIQHLPPGPPMSDRALIQPLRRRWENTAERSEMDVRSWIRMARSHVQLKSTFDHELERRKLAAMKELAYGASHEVNNPLANIATRAQTMLADESHPEKQRRLAVIYQQAMRAHEMISDMMLFAHPPGLQVRSVSLRLLMRKFLTRTEARLERFPGIEFRLTLGRGLDRVSVDPTQFLVAATQLVNNAVEAIEARAVPLTSPESRLPQSLGGAHVSGTIEVQLQRVEPSGWSLSVTDNGIGIEPRVAEHLFDPFFSGREAGRGLGFGLCKVWRIAMQHGGDVHHRQTDDGRTMFVMQLPTAGPAAGPEPGPFVSKLAGCDAGSRAA